MPTHCSLVLGSHEVILLDAFCPACLYSPHLSTHPFPTTNTQKPLLSRTGSLRLQENLKCHNISLFSATNTTTKHDVHTPCEPAQTFLQNLVKYLPPSPFWTSQTIYKVPLSSYAVHLKVMTGTLHGDESVLQELLSLLWSAGCFDTQSIPG